MRERSEAKWLDKCLQARVVQVLMANFLGRAAATIVLPKVASRLFQVQVGDLISTFAVQGSPASALPVEDARLQKRAILESHLSVTQHF